MGLLDKLKNVFFEEEYVEVEEIQEKTPKQEKPKENRKEKKTVAKRIELPKKEKREEEPEVVQLEEPEEVKKEILADRELLKPDTSFKFFEEDDFVEEIKVEKVVSTPPVDRREEKAPYGGALDKEVLQPYRSEPKEKKFQPTPIISPIYGILDKNYSKEDIVDKKEKRVASSYAKKVDLDTVRKRAYSGLYSDLGFTEDDNDDKNEEPKKEEIEDNLLYDMSDEDNTPTVEKVTIADAEEYFEDLGLEYNVDYKDKTVNKAKGRRVSHTPVIDKEMEDTEEIKTEVVEESKIEDDKTLEDNLFDLIDSMYEDKE